MTKVEETISLYLDMWKWMYRYLWILKRRYKYFIDAKFAYMQKIRKKRCFSDPFYLGSCILCVAYGECKDCPLVKCNRKDSPYKIITDYFNGWTSRRHAKRACRGIIIAHRALMESPTEQLKKLVCMQGSKDGE